MKVVKAKYYEETNEISPLDPQPIRNKDGSWSYERFGLDEKGKFVIIDFISEDSKYFEYEASEELVIKDLKETTEEEWNKPVTLDIESMDSTLQKNAGTVDVNTLQEFLTTNTKTSPPTFSTGIGKLMSIIGRLFSNVCNAIKKSYRR